MKVYEGVLGGKRNKWLNFSGDPDLILADICTHFTPIIADRGAGNNPEALGLGTVYHWRD